MNAVELSGVDKRFDSVHALDGIELTLAKEAGLFAIHVRDSRS